MSRFARTKFFLQHAWQSFRADSGLGIVGSPSPDSDYWYHGLGYRSQAGPNVSPATATRLAAVFACSRVVTETFGSLPCGIYRERKSGGRDRATDHPAQELFNNPNPWQTGMEFFELMQGHLELRGNAYALKVSGGGRAIEQLTPIHPDRVRVFLLPNGRLRYEVTSYSNGQVDKYSQDEMLHLRGWSFDGIMGISTVSANAEVIGVGLAQQEHRAGSFRNRAIPGMVIETVKLSEEAKRELTESIQEGFAGQNAFKVMALPPGMKATPMGLSNKDAQLIEASNATRVEICGAWRVPPHKIGDLSRGTFSNIEQQNIEFATDGMRPRIVRFERRLDRDIVQSLRAFESAGGDYYAVFNMDALFRGDMKSRFESYQLAVQTWLARNEIRAAEGKNPIDGLDEMLVPVNMETVSQAQKRSDANIAAASAKTDAADPAKDTPDNTAEPLPDENDADETKARVREARLRALATAAAGRVVRREVKALEKIASHPAELRACEVEEFYADQTALVAETLAVSMESAVHYTTGHCLLMSVAKEDCWDLIIHRIEEESTQTLAKLALAENPAVKTLTAQEVPGYGEHY